MAVFKIVAAVFSLCLLPLNAVGAPLPPSLSTEKLDVAVIEGISRGLIAGGVVLVGNRREILFQKAYGRTSGAADARPMTVDDIFDLASLTKVLATAPAILKLAEEGRLSLVDPIAKWFPEFTGKGKDDLLVLHLLTHTSGLDDVTLPATDPMAYAIRKAADQRLNGIIGNRFRYADLNFILLGEMVQRVTGMPLDRYVGTVFYTPLGMRDTGFNPDRTVLDRYSATMISRNALLVGEPQDENARNLGGVAGHAGLFGTVQDLALFCQMILNGGRLSGKEILSERAVLQMTVPYFSRGGAVARGLGWDIASPFSAPKGAGFSDYSFGHTGYSGGSIWIDAEADLFVVLLTARTEYRASFRNDFSQLRRNVSSVSAEIFGPFPLASELVDPPYEQF